MEGVPGTILLRKIPPCNAWRYIHDPAKSQTTANSIQGRAYEPQQYGIIHQETIIEWELDPLQRGMYDFDMIESDSDAYNLTDSQPPGTSPMRNYFERVFSEGEDSTVHGSDADHKAASRPRAENQEHASYPFETEKLQSSSPPAVHYRALPSAQPRPGSLKTLYEDEEDTKTCAPPSTPPQHAPRKRVYEEDEDDEPSAPTSTQPIGSSRKSPQSMAGTAQGHAHFTSAQCLRPSHIVCAK